MSSDRLPNESPEYRKVRAELLEAEIELKEQRERVAELRRRLPRDTAVADYRFRAVDLASDREIRDVTLCDLFEHRDRPVVLMQFMFGGKQQSFCPMCTMWADGYDGAVPHLDQRVNFAVVVAGELEAFRDHARARGWRHLRLLSSAGTSFKRDLHFENDEGGQEPGVSVFTLAPDGTPRHFYSGSAMMGEHYRGMDLLSPVWNFFDLTPEGRGEWFPSLSYER